MGNALGAIVQNIMRSVFNYVWHARQAKAAAAKNPPAPPAAASRPQAVYLRPEPSVAVVGHSRAIATTAPRDRTIDHGLE